MGKLLYLVFPTLGSGFGWWLGDFVGTGTAFLLSAIGTCAGFYVAYKLKREHFD